MASSSRSSWRGSITFGGFPINVAAFPLIESASAKSFKTLCACHGKPTIQPKMCSVDSTTLGPDQQRKGIEHGKGNFIALSPEQEDEIKNVQRSETLEILRLPELASVPLHLAKGQYRIVPDPKVPGAEQPVQILWNGLHENERGLVTRWVMRAGARDVLLVIHADEFGLNGTTLPWHDELRETPEFKPAPDAKAAAMFTQFAEMQGIEMLDFNHAAWESEYEARREAAVQAVIAGAPIPKVEEAAAEAPEVPDLMAMMQASLAKGGKSKPKSKAKSKAKATA